MKVREANRRLFLATMRRRDPTLYRTFAKRKLIDRLGDAASVREAEDLLKDHPDILGMMSAFLPWKFAETSATNTAASSRKRRRLPEPTGGDPGRAERLLRAAGDDAPAKAALPCAHLTVVPQSSSCGTCWFNAVLMVFFFSDGVRRESKKALARFASAGTSSDLLQRLATLLLLYKQPDLERVYGKAFGRGVAPEHLLGALVREGVVHPRSHAFDAGGFAGDGVIALLKVLRMTARVYKLKTKHTGKRYLYGIHRVRHRENVVPGNDAAAAPDLVIVETRAYFSSASAFDTEVTVDKKHTLVSREFPVPELHIDGHTYVLDAAIIDSYVKHIDARQGTFVKSDPHSIAGVTCDGAKMYYSGWKDKAAAYGRPCALIPVDWTARPIFIDASKSRTECYSETRKSYFTRNVYEFDGSNRRQPQLQVYVRK